MLQVLETDCLKLLRRNKYRLTWNRSLDYFYKMEDGVRIIPPTRIDPKKQFYFSECIRLNTNGDNVQLNIVRIFYSGRQFKNTRSIFFLENENYRLLCKNYLKFKLTSTNRTKLY